MENTLEDTLENTIEEKKSEENYSEPETTTESKDLLKEEGVAEMLAEIIEESEKNAALILESINKHLDVLDEEQREKDTYIILRELRGYSASLFHHRDRPLGCEEAFKVLAATCKNKKKAERISLHHTYSISPEKSTLLKNICPYLFES